MTDVDRTPVAAGPPRGDWLVDLFVVAVAVVLIFTRLGHYPFWGDEVDNVIYGRAIWETGDMDPWYGDNLYAYRDGAQLDNLRNRSAPPLQFYLTAPFWGAFGDDRCGLRLPFALCGVGVIALMQWGWRQLGLTAGHRLLLGVALACNTSFILYARQCRYYALAALLCVGVVFLYLTYDGSRRRLAALVGVGCLLIATQFMNFAALMAAVLVDYLLWHRRQRSLGTREWLLLLLPLGFVFAVLLYVYNPLRSDLYPAPDERNYWLDRLTLLKWSLRDMNRCEYGVGCLMIAAPLLVLCRRVTRGDSLVLRLFTGTAVFFIATVFLMPQPVAWTREADVRYLMPLIVPATALGVFALLAITGNRVAWAAALVLVAVLTNVLHVPLNRDAWRSSLFDYVQELRTPRRPASAVVAEWLRENATAGEWCAVVPTDWLPPQLVISPQLRYGWQLEKPKHPEQFAEVDPRLFVYRAPVDWILVHGFSDIRRVVEGEVLPKLRAAGQNYEYVTTLDCYFDDRTRPELIWHWFREQAYDREKHAVYVYRRSPWPALSP